MILLVTCVSGQDISETIDSSLHFFKSQIKDSLYERDTDSIQSLTVEYREIIGLEEIYILDTRGEIITDGTGKKGGRLDFIPSRHYEFWNLSVVVYDGIDYVFMPVIRKDSLVGYIVANLKIDEEESYEELYLKLESIKLSRQVESYLREHSEYTLQDLIDDKAFWELGIQKIGYTGYTAIATSNPFQIVIHPNDGVVGKGKAFFEENASALWKIVEPALETRCLESSGSYKWCDEKGDEIEKFIYFSCVAQTTSDNVTLSVAATASMDELKDKMDSLRTTEMVSNRALEIVVEEHDRSFNNQVLDIVSLSKAPILLSTLLESQRLGHKELFEMWSASESREFIEGIAIGDGDPTNDLNPDASQYLIDIKTLYKLYPEIFIADSRGYTVAATGATSDFDQGPMNWHMELDVEEMANDRTEEEWFTAGLISEGISFGNVEWDKSAKTWGIDIVVQIKQEEVIGLLKAVMDYDLLLEKIINSLAVGHEIYIINTEGHLVASSVDDYNNSIISRKFKDVIDLKDKNSGTIEYDGEIMSFMRSEAIENHIFIMISELERPKDSFASQSIRDKALGVAKQIEIYLKSNPDLTLKDLQNDPYFTDIAVQDVGMTGYTAVTDYETLICRFHKNPELIDFDLSATASSLPGFWNIMSRTKGGMEAEGIYDWIEPDGSIREKYMYIAVVGPKTADGVGLHVAATTYLDEYFTQTIEESETVQFDYIYILAGIFCLAIFMLFIFSKTDDGKIVGMKVHYKSMLGLGVLALGLHLYYLTTSNIILGTIAMRLVFASLLFFSMQIAIINLKVSHILLNRITIISGILVTSLLSSLIIFTDFVVGWAVYSPNSYGNIIYTHGDFFILYGILVLFYFIIPFIVQLISLDRHNKNELKFFIYTYACFLFIVLVDFILYMGFKTRNPIFILITPTLLSVFLGIGLTVRKIITQRRNTIMLTLAISLLMIILLFVMNTINVTNNLKDMEVENVIMQKGILLEHSIKDIENDIGMILDSVGIEDLGMSDEIKLKMSLKEVLRHSSITSNIYMIDGVGTILSQYPESNLSEFNHRQDILSIIEDGELDMAEIGGQNLLIPIVVPLEKSENSIMIEISMDSILNKYLDWAKSEEIYIVSGNSSYNGLELKSMVNSKVLSDFRSGNGGSLVSGEKEKRILHVYDSIALGNGFIGITHELSFNSIFNKLSSSIDKIWIFTIGMIVIIIIVGTIFNSILTRSLRKEVDSKTNKLTNMISELTDTKAAVMNMMEDITKANEELKELDQAKSNFLNMVSHELKTPLTAMNAHLEVLGDMSDNLKRQQLRSFDAIRRNSNQLRILIENILEIARIESNKFHLNLIELDLGGIINDVVDNLSIIAKNKDVKMTADVEKLDNIIADEARIKEILNNLVSNAIKFTENGEIMITAKENDKDILVSVRDSGIGIPEEKMGNLFQKFYQVDASLSRRYGGTGLGLSITKQLVELQGGKIWVDSKEGHGSEFFFTLPLKKSKG